MDLNYSAQSLSQSRTQNQMHGLKRFDQSPSPGRLPNQGPVDKESQLYKTAIEFEAIFIKQMLDVMRKTVPKDSLIDGGMAQEVFEDMLYDERSKVMARNAGFGLAKTIYHQWSAHEQLDLIASIPRAKVG